MLRLIIQLLWPSHNTHVKALVISSLLTVTVSCAVNFYVPISIQKIVDHLTYSVTNKTHEICWDLVLVFVILKTCQGVGSLSAVTALEQIIWIPIEQHVRRLIQVKFFHHIHSMSLNWMVNTKIGDILGALERGTDSISSTIEHLLYSIIPTLVDIVIAITYLSVKFGWTYGLITGLQISLYVFFTAFAIEKHAKYQSFINEQENELRQSTLESVINYETVKCFGNEWLEKRKYFIGLKNLQSKKFCIGILTSLLQTAQQTVISVGFLLCSLLALSSVVQKGNLTVGDYVLCTMYLGQLYGPLNYLAGYYRELRVNLINAKSMMDYFGEEPSIRDVYFAKDLKIREGAIEFRDVRLETDSGELILQDISFSVEPKTKVALVGCTGSGKTSIAKLLLRLYDPICGRIFIDGVDIKNVTIESLRRSVGIIPQNCDLFNDTIRNNIRYGDLTASDFDVTFAAALTGMHEKILSMPYGYDTIVGEKGARLSGGQRQLIAISRAILQNPNILILDEATSALDVNTEKQIREVINHLCNNRTCLMITHNLASTVDCDCIIVLKNGRIVERGSFQSLIKTEGHFAAMWNAQSRRREINEICNER